MERLRILILVCGIAISYMPFVYSKVNAVGTVSFTGVVPEVRCNSIKADIGSFTELDKNNDGRLTAEEFGEIKGHDILDIDFDRNGYISPIELSVYKKRNCLI
ncbi:hypothetical protein M3923_000927 [Vibrio metschnikovii]|nr:hypothetical protein [Vibrio metschnikovii]